jgi:hypothetical protein
MTKDDYKAKIREAISIGHRAGSLDTLSGVYRNLKSITETKGAIKDRIDKLVDKFLSEKDD